MEIAGGRPQLVFNTVAPFAGGTWNQDGVILFAQQDAPFRRASASGGAPSSVLDCPSGFRYPRFLPDGRRFLASISVGENAGLYLLSMDAKEKRLLRQGCLAPVHLPPTSIRPGYLFFTLNGQLMAQPFDAGKAELSGEAMLVAEPFSGQPQYTASRTGILTFRKGRGLTSQLAWFGRDGTVLGTVDSPMIQIGLSISADQRLAAISRGPGDTRNIWLIDLVRGAASRLTMDSGGNFPTISPDGASVAFECPGVGIVRKSTSRLGKEEVLLKATGLQAPTSWSRDGRWLAFTTSVDNGGYNVSLLPLTGDRKPVPLTQDGFDNTHANISPDGRWIAYNSQESGRPEVYVRSMPGAPGTKWQISTAGGSYPRWRGDGKEMYFLSADGKMMVAGIQTVGAALQAEVPRTLFQAVLRTTGAQNYDVAADGKRFLLNVPVQDSAREPITVVLNWRPGLKL